jgi:hypothetical protein
MHIRAISHDELAIVLHQSEPFSRNLRRVCRYWRDALDATRYMGVMECPKNIICTAADIRRAVQLSQHHSLHWNASFNNCTIPELLFPDTTVPKIDVVKIGPYTDCRDLDWLKPVLPDIQELRLEVHLESSSNIIVSALAGATALECLQLFICQWERSDSASAQMQRIATAVTALLQMTRLVLISEDRPAYDRHGGHRQSTVGLKLDSLTKVCLQSNRWTDVCCLGDSVQSLDLRDTSNVDLSAVAGARGLETIRICGRAPTT